MKYQSAIMTAASGSVGGATYSRNRYGAYIRSKGSQVNPNTDAQNAARVRFTQAIAAWTNVLTPSEREAWNTYGTGTPAVDRLGGNIMLTGQNWFVGACALHLQAGLPLPTVSPTQFDRGTIGNLVLDHIDLADTEVSFSAATGGDWNATGGQLFIQMGKPQNGSRNFFAGPWKHAAVIPDTGVVTGTFQLATGSLPYAVTEGQAVWFRLVGMAPDGRYTSPRLVSTIVIDSTE